MTPDTSTPNNHTKPRKRKAAKSLKKETLEIKDRRRRSVVELDMKIYRVFQESRAMGTDFKGKKEGPFYFSLVQEQGKMGREP